MKTFIKLVAGFGAIFVIIILLSFPTMWLWNWLMPEIFGLTTINIWQALGIMILSHILFKQSKS